MPRWKALLAAEAQALGGQGRGQEGPLARIWWRHSRWVRLILALLEHSQEGSSEALQAAQVQLRRLLGGFGDEKLAGQLSGGRRPQRGQLSFTGEGDGAE